MDLTGKKILVAGVSSSIGEQIVYRMLDLGASLCLVDRDKEKLEEISHSSDSPFLDYRVFDIYSNEAIESNFKEINREFGVFDGFVFSGGMGGVRPLSFTKQNFLHEMMNANLYSFIEMVRCITKKDCFKEGGSIVAISSVSSIRGLKSKTVYSASKAALDASIKNMAAELANKRIRVNSILKGWVTSDLQQDFIKSNMELNADDDFKKQVLGAIEPVEIANTVAFLLSDATKTMTGTNLLLDGGYTL